MSLLSDKERRELEKAYRRVAKCNGNCKDCKRLQFNTAKTERGTAYAFSCKGDGLGMYHNGVNTMRIDILRQLIFEMS